MAEAEIITHLSLQRLAHIVGKALNTAPHGTPSMEVRPPGALLPTHPIVRRDVHFLLGPFHRLWDLAPNLSPANIM